MTTLETRKCVVCGKNLSGSDPRKMYCSNACKQVPYRKNKGIAPPAFLTVPKIAERHAKLSKEVGKPVESAKNGPVSKKQTNPVYQSVANEIGGLEQRLDGLRRTREANLRAEATILSEDETLLGIIETGLTSAGVLVLTALIGYLVSQSTRDRKQGDKTKMIVFIIGLGLAVFVAAINHTENVDKVRQRKLRKIVTLKQQNEQLELTINELDNILAVKRVELVGTSVLIRQPQQVQLQPMGNVRTASELRGMSFDLLNVPPVYVPLIGRPERGFSMAVHGAPGQGKSTFTARLAYDLAVANGNGIYISAEEGFSQSLQNKMAEFTTDHLSFSDHRTLDDVEYELQQNHYDVAVLDSVQQMNIGPDELLRLRQAYPRTSFIYILQATKGGDFKGNNRFAHDADVQIKLDGYVPVCQKTRFSRE